VKFKVEEGNLYGGKGDVFTQPHPPKSKKSVALLYITVFAVKIVDILVFYSVYHLQKGPFTLE